MSLQEALLARAKADPALAAVVGSRIYWRARPQTSALPALVLAMVGGERPQTIEDFADMAEARVQASLFADRYATSRIGIEAAIAALVPEAEAAGILFWRGSASEPVDLGEQTSSGFVFHAAADLVIRWGPAGA